MCIIHLLQVEKSSEIASFRMAWNATVFYFGFGFGYFHVVFIEKSILDISQSQRQSYTLHAHGHVSVGGWVLSW